LNILPGDVIKDLLVVFAFPGSSGDSIVIQVAPGDRLGKIVGLEVMPRRPSSSIILFNSPAVIISRLRLSYQKLWLYSWSCRSGFVKIRTSW
jgi:hypothetical protein